MSAFIAINECAPRSNTSSWMPMCSIFSNRLQMAASVFSVPVRGPTHSRAGSAFSKGRAASPWRSILPFGVNGSRSIRTNADGTMYWGKRAFRCSRNVAGGVAACFGLR